ncbi:MAG: PIN domain-containing protein [Rhodospirillales bacterium]|nr:PIN domain-containing protein [Rhodospirillales bacterium]
MDTNVFVNENFDYRSRRFRSLVSLASDDIVNVFLTDITVREIKAQLQERVAKAVPIKLHPILKNSSNPVIKRLPKSVTIAALEQELMSQFDEFMMEARVAVLPVPNSVLPDVLDDYFDRRAPFGVGKNKCEFPDALALHELQLFCKSKNCQMAVITSDKAVQNACDEADCLCLYESLSKYLDSVASDNRSKSEFVRQRVLQQQTVLSDKAKDQFEHMGFSLTDQDGDVEDVDLTSVELDDKAEIISLEDDWAEVEVPVTFSFQASVSYNEPGTGFYDKEDDRLLWPIVIREKVKRELHSSLYVEILFKDLDPNSVEIGEVQIQGPDIIDVKSDYWEPPLK